MFTPGTNQLRTPGRDVYRLRPSVSSPSVGGNIFSAPFSRTQVPQGNSLDPRLTLADATIDQLVSARNMGVLKLIARIEVLESTNSSLDNAFTQILRRLDNLDKGLPSSSTIGVYTPPANHPPANAGPASFVPPQLPSAPREEDCTCKYWSQDAYSKVMKARSESKPSKPQGKGRKKMTQDGDADLDVYEERWFYFEDKYGRPLSCEWFKCMRAKARNIFQDFHNRGCAPATWGTFGDTLRTYFINTMYINFPELRFCSLDWKLTEWAKITYPSWYQHNVRKRLNSQPKRKRSTSELGFDLEEDEDEDNHNQKRPKSIPAVEDDNIDPVLRSEAPLVTPLQQPTASSAAMQNGVAIAGSLPTFGSTSETVSRVLSRTLASATAATARPSVNVTSTVNPSTTQPATVTTETQSSDGSGSPDSVNTDEGLNRTTTDNSQSEPETVQPLDQSGDKDSSTSFLDSWIHDPGLQDAMVKARESSLKSKPYEVKSGLASARNLFAHDFCQKCPDVQLTHAILGAMWTYINNSLKDVAEAYKDKSIQLTRGLKNKGSDDSE